MPSLLMIQWGTIGLFMFLYFLQGFLRGTSKSVYYTLVTVITAGVTIWLISMVSLNLIFSASFTFESLIQMIQSMSGNIIPQNIETYLLDPQITPVVIALIDLVLRIVFYFVLFPVIKTLLTWIIFVPIWKFFIKKPLLARQNDIARVKHEESNSNRKFVPSKRLKKTVISRFGGGLAGAVHGFVVAFLFLLPVIIFSSFLTGFTSIANLEQENEYQTLDTGTLPGGLPFALPGNIDIEDYLLQIEEMNEKGLTSITKQIVINGQPLDRYVFDRMLTTTIKQEGLEDVNINWVQEIENIFGIASVVLEGGYIDSDFDYNTIGEDNLEDIEQIFNYIGRSNVLGYMIPYATRFGLENILVDQLGVNLYERDASRDALNQFEDISWDEEFSNLYGVIEALLKFGTVGELQAYASNPELIFELTPEEAEKLTNIIRAVGELETLVLINVAVDYATTMESVQNYASWIDESEREAYLQERLSFILSDPNFFVGEAGEFYHIADFVEALFTDQYGDVDLAYIVNNASNPATYLNEDTGAYFGHIINQLVDIRLLMESIPIGIDFGVYNTLDGRLSDEVQDDIAARLEEVVWSDEITNISDIYVEATKLGLQALFGENPNYYAFVDDLAVNNIDALRSIVSLIFEESEVVNIGLEIAVPIVLDSVITDPNLRTLVDEAIKFDSTTGEVNFNFGQEINNVITILETVYKFSTASELASFSTMTTEARLQVFANFGALSETDYDTFKDALEDLQVLSRVGREALIYARDSLGITQVYVPNEVALGEELTAITGLLYYAAQYTHDQLVGAGLLEDIDYAPLFNDPVFRSHLLTTELDNHSSLLLQTIAHNIKVFSEDPALSQYLSIPDSLAAASPEDLLWEEELNNLLGFVFDFAGSFEGASDFTFSLRDVLTVANNPTGINMSLITRFSDLAVSEHAFGSLDESIILRSSIKRAMDTYGATLSASLGGYEVKTPSVTVENDALKEETFVEFIHGVTTLIKGMNETLGFETLAEAIENQTTAKLIHAYQQTSDQDIEVFGQSELISGLIGDALISEDFQAFLLSTVNNAQTILVVPSDFFSVDPVLMDGDFFKTDEVINILIAVKAVELSDGENMSTIGLGTFTGLDGRNIDPETNDDDFDRLIGAHYIYILLDRALKLPSISDFVGTTLGDALGVAVTDLDLTPHSAMLSTDPNEPVELGRVPKDEFRRIFHSISLLGDPSALGLGTFTNLIDPYEDEDGFSDFIASDYIYIVLARLFENEGFGDYVGGLLAGVFGDDQEAPDMTPPSDAKGQVVGALDEDVITRVELRNIMVSFKLIGADDPSAIGIGSVMSLIDQNYDALEDKDDMDRFLDSLYIQDKLSFLLLSDSVIELIANGMFIPADFDIPQKALITVDGKDRIIQQELYNIFAGLKTLGIVDEDSLSTIGPDTLFGLTEAEVDLVVTSDYLYTVIDLFLKGQDTFEIPLSALNPNTDPDYPDKVKKSEITDIFKTLNILQVENLDTFEPQLVTIAQINEVLAETDSAIVLSLLSQGIIDAIGADKIPSEAYQAENLLTKEEIEALVAALEIIAGSDDVAIGDVDVESITVGQVQQIDLTPTGSYIIKQLISDEILNLIDVNNLPEDAYAPLSNGGSSFVLLGATLDAPVDPLRRLSDDELQEIVAALYILADDPNNTDPEFDPANVIVTEISTEATVGQAQQLKTNNSLVIRSLITDAVIDNLGATVVIHDDAYDVTYPTLLSTAEINALLDAMYILAGEDDTVLISAISTDVTVGQTQNLKGNASLIMRQLFTDQIKDAIDPLDEGKIPAEAYDLDRPTMFTQQELDAMLDALYILANNNPPFGYPGHDPLFDVNAVLVANVSTDVSVGQVSELKGTESYTIKQLVSDNVIDVIGVDNIPMDSYIDSNPANRLTDAEIDAMIDALVILAEPEDPYAVLVTAISTDVTVGQVKDLNLINSLITKQLISDSIIDSIGVDNIPIEAYIDSDPLNRLSDDELDAMILALDVLANNDDSVLVSAISTDVTVGQALDMKQTESYIIQQLLSDAIIDAIDPLDEGKIPLEAYIDQDSNNRLLQTEIDHMIDALYVLSNEDEDVLVSDITTDLTIGQLKGLNSIPSIIMKKQMSDQIIDAVGVDKVPLDAYIDQDNTKNLTDTELTEMIEALEILAGSVVPGDVDHVLVSAVSTDVTVGQTKQLDQDNESLIIKQIISDAIIDMIGVDGIPLDAYIDNDSNNRLTDTEIGNMVDALDILANNNDALLVTDISTDITIGQLKDLNALPSLITQKLISDTIIEAVGVDNVPMDAYIDEDDEKNLTSTEVSEMILALEILAGSTVPGDVDHILVTDVVIDVTVGQTQSLKTNNSVIIKQILSDNIVTMLTTSGIEIPVAAYRNNDDEDRLTNDEIGYMIDALFVLSGEDNNAKVDEIVFDETALSVETLQSFDENSLVLNRVISTGLITNLPNIPDESYVVVIDPLDPDYKKDILRIEINNILDALDILGITDTSSAGSIGANSITFADIYLVLELGTVGEPNEHYLGFSPIVAHIMSTPMVESVSDVRGGYDYGIPSTAYRNDYDLTYDEIVKLVEALAYLGDVGDAPRTYAPADRTLLQASSGIDPTGFGPDELDALLDIESLIVYRMISIGINDAGLENEDARAEVGDTNYDAEVIALPTPLIYDIKIAEMEHLVVSMNLLGLDDLTDLTSIDASTILGLSDADMDTLLDNEITIMYYLINDIIEDQPLLVAQLDPSDFEDFAPYRIKRVSLITLLKDNNI